MAHRSKHSIERSSKKSAGNLKSSKTITETPPEQEEMYDPSKIGVTIALLCTRWPSLDATERAAYRALATDEQRSHLGRQTKAERVLNEATRWAIQIDDELRLHTDALEYYSAERFAYYLERVQALHERLSAEEARRVAVGQKRGTAVSQRDFAVQIRRRLIGRMKSFAGERDAECGQLEAAIGTIDTDDNLGKSIAVLASLATSWIARTDATSQVHAKDAGLTQARIAEAVRAAKTLTAAGVDASMGGNLPARDSPVVNRDEGDVLLEMGEALRRLDLARDDNPAVKKLIPGPATRQVLASRPKKAMASSPGDQTPPPANP
jgi:hypothetical protein